MDESLFEPQEPTKAQMVFAHVFGNASSTYIGLRITSTARIPAPTMGLIDAMAAKSNLSRNDMMVALLEAGAEAVLNLADEESVLELQKMSDERAFELVKKAEAI